MNTSYSGIITKVRAMDKALLTDEDFLNLTSSDSVVEAINLLKDNIYYGNILDKDINLLHRGQLEELLLTAIYNDFIKLYKFAYADQRKFLMILFQSIEINILKQILDSMNKKEASGLKPIESPFIISHLSFDIEKLYNCSSFDEFIAGLSGTKYYKVLKTAYDFGVTNYTEYKSKLDIFLYTSTWRMKDQFLTDDNLKAYTDVLGREIDLLNITWVYRCKKYYNVDPTLILKDYCIPVNYKLSKVELSKLIEAESANDFINILNKTAYTAKGKYAIDFDDIDTSIYNILYDTHQNCIRQYPKSMSLVHFYLFKRQHEIENIITAVESVRYNVKR